MRVKTTIVRYIEYTITDKIIPVGIYREDISHQIIEVGDSDQGNNIADKPKHTTSISVGV